MKDQRQRGRPKTLEDSLRFTVSLDDETVKKAEKIGEGIISAGIRIAVAKYKIKGKKDE